MDGLINLDKPPGISSARALDRVRRVLGQRHSGHAGTLDPAAGGVLLVCLGKATRLVERLMDQPKIYVATARLDVTSESYDAARPMVPVDVSDPPETRRVLEAAARLEGLVAQLPPAISAIKVGGQRAYRLARSGQKPRLAPRTVRIYWIHVIEYRWPCLSFELACGRGTYVRALIRDWGAALGVGGCLTALVREAIGPFRRAEAHSLEQIEQAADPGRFVLPPARVMELLSADLPPVPPRPGGEKRNDRP
jgi:tRNA pseudouridine55 synthase